MHNKILMYKNKVPIDPNKKITRDIACMLRIFTILELFKNKFLFFFNQ